MTALYPKDLDSFRRYLNFIDDMVAQDLNDAIDAAIAVENELGVNPSMKKGTIRALLLQNGNISERFAAWNRLQWRQKNVNKNGSNGTIAFARGQLFGFEVTFPAGSMQGHDTIFGEDAPGVFGALQGPLNQTPGSQGRGGRPWRTAITRSTKDGASWIGMDGQGADFSSTNAESFTWGYIAWNLIP